MPGKKAQTPEIKPVEEPKKGPSFFEYLRFGESYTSLILGIIVVIISTALLLSFVHSRNTVNNSTPSPIALITATNIPLPTLLPTTIVKPTAELTVAPTVKPTAKPTVKPTVAPTVKPTAKPTVKPTVKPTEVQKKVALATKTPTKALVPTVKPKAVAKPAVKAGEYIVKHGDTLWSIAEAQYKSGYNWVDIAKANNLSNPGQIFAGNKLVLPKIATKPATDVAPTGQVNTSDENNSSTKVVSNTITGKSYKIVHGDTLWSIAVRAYGDGYKWVDIAKVNNLASPGLIHADNVLTIPRNNNP